MNGHDDATIWKVAEALHSFSHSTPFSELDSSEHMEYFGMAEAALAAVDANRQDDRQPDTDLVRWNPDSGSLWSALKEVPGDHMVTVTITADEVRELHSKVMSAEWRPPLPAWARPNLPLVVAVDEEFLVLGDDMVYHRYFLPIDTFKRTTSEVDQMAAQTGNKVQVVIDAYGHHVKEQP